MNRPQWHTTPCRPFRHVGPVPAVSVGTSITPQYLHGRAPGAWPGPSWGQERLAGVWVLETFGISTSPYDAMALGCARLRMILGVALS